MTITVVALFAFARLKKSAKWTTLGRKFPFESKVTESGSEYIPDSGRRFWEAAGGSH